MGFATSSMLSSQTGIGIGNAVLEIQGPATARMLRHQRLETPGAQGAQETRKETMNGLSGTIGALPWNKWASDKFLSWGNNVLTVGLIVLALLTLYITVSAR